MRRENICNRSSQASTNALTSGIRCLLSLDENAKTDLKQLRIELWPRRPHRGHKYLLYGHRENTLHAIRSTKLAGVCSIACQPHNNIFHWSTPHFRLNLSSSHPTIGWRFYWSIPAGYRLQQICGVTCFPAFACLTPADRYFSEDTRRHSDKPA